MGLMFMWRFGMWRFGFCVVALVAAPALAQTLQYDEDNSLPRHRSEWAGSGRHHSGRRHPRSLSSGDIEPFRLGPAPTGFWYRCDAPAGYYPYIPACGIPWRIVPSTPPR
ncbi:MAG: hypothetical protein QOF70_3573 [Acetobacteraceae bacterium]|jgi:hypothetical protein|nr:hypothetical protein [Acetobacteraceae bacterium]